MGKYSVQYLKIVFNNFNDVEYFFVQIKGFSEILWNALENLFSAHWLVRQVTSLRWCLFLCFIDDRKYEPGDVEDDDIVYDESRDDHPT